MANAGEGLKYGEGGKELRGSSNAGFLYRCVTLCAVCMA
jgi:hypothetical protein